MLISYLCGICNTLQLLSIFIGTALGGHILVTVIINGVNSTSLYVENQKQIPISKTEKVLCALFLLMALFVPANLKWDLIDTYKKDLQEQRQQVIQANQQISTFNLYLKSTNQVDKFTEFYNKLK